MIEKPDRVARGNNEIRAALRSLIESRVTLSIQVSQVIQANNIAFVVSAWSVSASGGEAASAELARGAGTDVMRCQPDGSWRFLIDNPYGTAVAGKMGGHSTQGAIG
jgi:ketosteroid isomerase-like protein